jgi:hypothetical protein
MTGRIFLQPAAIREPCFDNHLSYVLLYHLLPFVTTCRMNNNFRAQDVMTKNNEITNENARGDNIFPIGEFDDLCYPNFIYK